MVQNKQIIFKEIPEGAPVAGKHLKVETTEFDIEQAPPSGGVTTKNLYASFDPYQRGRMRDSNVKSYSPPYYLNQPINNSSGKFVCIVCPMATKFLEKTPSDTHAVAKIIKSDNPKFQAGDLVTGMLSTEEYSALPKQYTEGLKKIENPHNLDPAIFIGPLGMTGLTAYSSLYEIGKPKKGETIFISAASGAVGAVVGQIAKHEGLKVIGSVGTDEKLDYITKELGFDGGFNYKKEDPVKALQRLAPDGIDIYYENVGGVQLEAAIDVMNDFGRIIGCGMVSEYSKPKNERYGVKNLMLVISKRITFRGFIVGDKEFGPKYAEERSKNITKWLADGSMKAKLSVVDGIDNGPEGLVGMLEGKNFGKTVLKIADA